MYYLSLPYELNIIIGFIIGIYIYIYIPEEIRLQDNALPHSSCTIVQTSHGLGYEIWEQPPYPPDISSTDYQL